MPGASSVLGHASLLTTQRYIECDEDLSDRALTADRTLRRVWLKVKIIHDFHRISLTKTTLRFVV